MAPERPNLLFLMTDHQRADSIGMVQAGVEVTPNLNRLASQGAFFPRCYNTCPLCVPARTALFTGRYPTATGVVYNDWKGQTAGDFVPLQQVLAEAGYEVAEIGVDHIRLRPPLRERVPFAFWSDGQDYRQHLERLGIDRRPPGGPERFKVSVDELVGGEIVTSLVSNTRTAVWPHPAEHFLDLYWCRRAVEFLRGPLEPPFALFLFLWAPHPPLVVPEPYASMFDPGALELPPNVDVPARGEPPGRRRGVSAQMAEGVPMDEWRRAWAAHLGLVRMADDGLGSVLAALEQTGRDAETLVCFTVDHGEQLGQHRMYQKMEMYEPAVRVPLIIRAAGGGAGRFEGPVSHLDVMPTLLELCGLEAPAGLDGISLAASVTGGSRPPERPVFGQYSGNPGLGDIRRAVITRRHKYVYDPRDEPELFDLEADPLEMRNIAAEPAAAGIVRELHAACAAWHREHGDWVCYD